VLGGVLRLALTSVKSCSYADVADFLIEAIRSDSVSSSNTKGSRWRAKEVSDVTIYYSKRKIFEARFHSILVV